MVLTWEGAALLLLPWVSTFVGLSAVFYPLLSVIELLLFALPVGYAVAGWLLYLVSGALGGVSLQAAHWVTGVFILIPLPIIVPVIRHYYRRRLLWLGKLVPCPNGLSLPKGGHLQAS